VLRHVYPAADIPVVELSIDERKLASFHFEIGKKLAPLREEGVLAPCIRSSALSRTLSAIFDTPLPREPGAVSRASPAKRGRLSKTLDTADGSPPWTAGRSGASSLSGIFWFTSTKARSSESYGEFN